MFQLIDADFRENENNAIVNQENVGPGQNVPEAIDDMLQIIEELEPLAQQ